MPVDQAAGLDPLWAEARELLLANQNPSVAFLQRHWKIGYNRALRMMQIFEADIVTTPDADGWRQMLHSGNRSPTHPQSPRYKLED